MSEFTEAKAVLYYGQQKQDLSYWGLKVHDSFSAAYFSKDQYMAPQAAQNADITETSTWSEHIF